MVLIVQLTDFSMSGQAARFRGEKPIYYVLQAM